MALATAVMPGTKVWMQVASGLTKLQVTESGGAVQAHPWEAFGIPCPSASCRPSSTSFLPLQLPAYPAGPGAHPWQWPPTGSAQTCSRVRQGTAHRMAYQSQLAEAKSKDQPLMVMLYVLLKQVSLYQVGSTVRSRTAGCPRSLCTGLALCTLLARLTPTPSHTEGAWHYGEIPALSICSMRAGKHQCTPRRSMASSRAVQAHMRPHLGMAMLADSSRNCLAGSETEATCMETSHLKTM